MTTLPPTPKGEATRAKVIRAAHRLFLKRGFNGTSMRDIAEGAGLVVGGLYNHFASKDEIFAAVLDAYHPYHAIVPALEQCTGDTAEAVLRTAATQVQAATRHVETRLLPLVLTELVEFQGRHLKALAEQVFPAFLGFAEQFAARPGLRRDLPLPVILRGFMTLMIGYLLTEMIFKKSARLKNLDYDWFEGLVEIYLHGVLAPPTDH